MSAVMLATGLEALVAAALYVASYLSFVRLLRYIRNWLPPSLSGSLVTGLFMVLTMLAVALSPTGLDYIYLAVSVAFFALMASVIAAPAIAFRPTHPVLEFFAKHADYAGPWLLGPALMAGLITSNAKFQAVLAVAMAIEMTWFLRQRWANRARRNYRLNDHDLSVLETQAQGDLPAFARRHGIQQLKISPGAVSWNGCGKHTSPCPFNLYVNRLGLNTAPCCREHMHDLAYHVTASLREIGAVHWLEGGSLLGAVRENGALLDWEDDVDISVLLDDDMTWAQLAAGLRECGLREGYHVDIFEQSGLVAVSFDPPRNWPFRWERNRLRGEIRADIAVYRHAVSKGDAVLERRSYKGAMPATENGGFGVPRDMVLPISTIPFLDREFPSPNQPEAYLQVLYGDFRKVEYTYVAAAAATARAKVDTTS